MNLFVINYLYLLLEEYFENAIRFRFDCVYILLDHGVIDRDIIQCHMRRNLPARPAAPCLPF